MLRVGDVGGMNGKCRNYDSGGQMIFLEVTRPADFAGRKTIARQRHHGSKFFHHCLFTWKLCAVCACFLENQPF
jgi:hypothetical protein